jgi:hypothetical protein
MHALFVHGRRRGKRAEAAAHGAGGAAELAQVVECRMIPGTDKFEYYVHYVDCTSWPACPCMHPLHRAAPPSLVSRR